MDAGARESVPWTTRTIESLIALSEIGSTPDTIDSKLESICATATRMLACDRSSIFLYRPDGTFIGSHNAGNPPDIDLVFRSHAVALQDPLVSEAFRRGHYVLVEDAVSDDRMNDLVAARARIRSIILSPLFTLDRQPLAFITAEFNESKGSFTEAESRLLDAIARVAELTIRTADLQAEREELVEQALRSDRLDTIRRLSAGLAHDLNNRLMVILGTIELLPDHVHKDALQPIHDAADAAARMTRQLLQFGRGDLGRSGRCNVMDVLTALEPELRRAVASKAVLTLDNRADVTVGVTATQLHQVLVNLVMNAFDAIEETGFIHVVSLRRPDGTWTCLVQDTGSGVDEEVAGRLFEPFVTTKRLGSGLGLCGVAGIVASAGGRVGFRDNEPAGTIFEVRLPTIVERESAQSAPAPDLRRVTAPLRIAVVDDDEAVRSIVQSFVEREGHTSVLSTTGRDPRLDRLEDVDLIVCDMVMPLRDGLQLCAALRKRMPALRILLVSGYYPSADMELRVPPGSEFLTKPFSLEQLRHKVDRLVLSDVSAPTRRLGLPDAGADLG